MMCIHQFVLLNLKILLQIYSACCQNNSFRAGLCYSLKHVVTGIPHLVLLTINFCVFT
jgi:hypothetical protein